MDEVLIAIRSYPTIARSFSCRSCGWWAGGRWASWCNLHSYSLGNEMPAIADKGNYFYLAALFSIIFSVGLQVGFTLIRHCVCLHLLLTECSYNAHAVYAYCDVHQQL